MKVAKYPNMYKFASNFVVYNQTENRLNGNLPLKNFHQFCLICTPFLVLVGERVEPVFWLCVIRWPELGRVKL